jgi:hypothetical protein
MVKNLLNNGTVFNYVDDKNFDSLLNNDINNVLDVRENELDETFEDE